MATQKICDVCHQPITADNRVNKTLIVGKVPIPRPDGSTAVVEVAALAGTPTLRSNSDVCARCTAKAAAMALLQGAEKTTVEAAAAGATPPEQAKPDGGKKAKG